MKTLTWKYDTTVPVSCPDRVPNQYTGEYSMIGCAVYHTQTVTKEMAKSFETYEEVEAFKRQAPTGCYDWKLFPAETPLEHPPEVR